MQIRSGIQPVTLDLNDFSWHGTFRQFGATSLPQLPNEFSVDAGLTIPDQNRDGYPWGCTGYAQGDNSVDELGLPVRYPFIYLKTCFYENHDTNEGCLVRNSLKMTRDYGIQLATETTDEEAAQHRGGYYFNVYDDGGLDWFDSIRVAIWKEHKGASLCSPWFNSWNSIANHGLLPTPLYFELQTAKKHPDKLPWHNYSCKGWKMINSQPYLLIKSWKGKEYADNGWAYMDRSTANTVFELRGSGIFMQTHANKDDIVSIQISMLETVVHYLSRWLGILRLN